LNESEQAKKDAQSNAFDLLTKFKKLPKALFINNGS